MLLLLYVPTRKRFQTKLRARATPSYIIIGCTATQIHLQYGARLDFQFVLDQSSLEPFSLEQVLNFLLHERDPTILWLTLGDVFLWTSPSFPVSEREFKPVLNFRCSPDTGFIWVFQRRERDSDKVIWPITDFLMCLGSASDCFELHGTSSRSKVFSHDGLETFLQKSPNISTLKFYSVCLDKGSCRLLGDICQSPLKLRFRYCNLECPEGFGDGMRQNGGPTELIIAGLWPFGFPWRSIGPMITNTKLQSLVLKQWMYFDSGRSMERYLYGFFAQGLRRIEIEFHTGKRILPSELIIVLATLARHHSLTTVRFLSTGVLDIASIVNALRSNFLITTIYCGKLNDRSKNCGMNTFILC
jgi:hypothetical protein